MSFDLKLSTTCNHKIYRELSILDTDLKSLRLSKPLASAVSIELYASDNLIPKDMYKVIYDPTTIDVSQPRMIFLSDRWQATEDFFEVNYVTARGFCPKCAGLDVIDDISFDVRGRMKEQRNENLLLQNMEKFTVTEISSNPFHGFIGTSLVSLLGNKVLDSDFLTTKIIQEINATLMKLKDMQAQYETTGRPVTNGEMLQSVDFVEVNFDDEDPTILRADITATARSGKSVDFSQYLKIA